MAPHFCVFIPVLLCCFTFSLGSRIQFSSQPAQVTPSLTPEVTLTCGLHDTDPVTSGNLVGRDLHDVIHTDENMKFVTVVSLLHNTERVASVSEHVQAKILNKWTNAAVTGKVDSSSSTKGFLSVTITAPQVNQTGHFSCEIHTLHPVDFQDVKFSQTVAVTAVPPTLAQWMEYVGKQGPGKQNNTGELDALKMTLKDKEAELSARKMAVQAKNVTLFEFERRHNILMLNNTANNIPNTGVTTSTTPDHFEFSIQNVWYCIAPAFSQFSKPYSKPPTVITSEDDSSFPKASRYGVVFGCDPKIFEGLLAGNTNVTEDKLSSLFLILNWQREKDEHRYSLRAFFPPMIMEGPGFDPASECANRSSIFVPFGKTYKTPPSIYILFGDPGIEDYVSNTTLPRFKEWRMPVVDTVQNGIASIDTTGAVFSCTAMENVMRSYKERPVFMILSK